MKLKGKNYDEIFNELNVGNPAQRACALALNFGDIDGAHHKQWVIDQMLRILAGNAYHHIIATYQAKGYDWDTGIEP